MDVAYSDYNYYYHFHYHYCHQYYYHHYQLATSVSYYWLAIALCQVGGPMLVPLRDFDPSLQGRY